MYYDKLIDVESLARLLNDQADVLLLDCRFDLTDPGAGKQAYDEHHIPGAHYVHLEQDLSGAATGHNGRHPLPDRAGFAELMTSLGAKETTQIVAYDGSGGMYAARLWWLARWAGHGCVAVLDGGIAAWAASGRQLTDEVVPPVASPTGFPLREPLAKTVDIDDVRANLAQRDLLLIDARAADRFRGENETLDPVGGHIPGARNRLFRLNLDERDYFRKPEELRLAFESLIEGFDSGNVVSQCGSGVTGCHNLLAMEVAGLGGASLYPGSWSEWCAQPDAPVATGTSS